jgi:hypothetical protein
MTPLDLFLYIVAAGAGICVACFVGLALAAVFVWAVIR